MKETTYLSKAWRASCFSLVCSAWSEVSLDCWRHRKRHSVEESWIMWGTKLLSDMNMKCLEFMWAAQVTFSPSGEREGKRYRLNAQLHSLSVQLDGFIVVSLLVFLKGLSDQEVGPLHVHLLPGLQRVALLCLDWGERFRAGQLGHRSQVQPSGCSRFSSTLSPTQLQPPTGKLLFHMNSFFHKGKKAAQFGFLF